MLPSRARFPRLSASLAAALALGIVALACEMPSPEMLAPTGEDVETRRVYGTIAEEKKVEPAQPDPALRSLILSRHPELGQGAGPSLVYLVKDAAGAVVESARQDAAFARMPAARAYQSVPDDTSGKVERMSVVRARQSQAALSANEERAALRLTADSIHMRQRQEAVVAQGASRRKATAIAVPSEVPINFGALRPGDIASIEITKFAAGRIGPDPVSVIMVSLKPGVRVPLREGAR